MPKCFKAMIASCNPMSDRSIIDRDALEDISRSAPGKIFLDRSQRSVGRIRSTELHNGEDNPYVEAVIEVEDEAAELLTYECEFSYATLGLMVKRSTHEEGMATIHECDVLHVSTSNFPLDEKQTPMKVISNGEDN